MPCLGAASAQANGCFKRLSVDDLPLARWAAAAILGNWEAANYVRAKLRPGSNKREQCACFLASGVRASRTARAPKPEPALA